LIGRYSADAVRYWACGGSVGSDQPVSEEVMKQGGRLVTKLWNAARFVAGHLHDFDPAAERPPLQPADRALLSWLQRLIARVTTSFREYEYATAKEATERFFWGTFCDNYLEWVKGRLYDASGAERRAAQCTLYQTLLALLKLFAPIMPHIAEEIHAQMFAQHTGARSIHVSPWPEPDEALIDEAAERAGDALLAITTGVRRFKSAQKLGVGAELARLTILACDTAQHTLIEGMASDLRSVTRAREVVFAAEGEAGFEEVAPGLWVRVEG
jgi:valyl-tRNA synthetase